MITKENSNFFILNKMMKILIKRLEIENKELCGNKDIDMEKEEESQNQLC